MVSTPQTSRRAFLTGATGALAATSGCVGEIRSLVGRQRASQLSLNIKTPPAGEDPYAVRIANHVADNLSQSGVETVVDPVSFDVLFRDILINHDFDLYVARYPSQGDPDELRSMLYSSYGEESGWQNPFGFSSIEMDDALDEQRTAESEDRVRIVHEIQRQIVQSQPFTVIVFPDRIGAVRTDRFDGWPTGGLSAPTDYLQLERVGDTTTLNPLLRNERITRNRNPLAAEYRNQGDLIGLLYEPLVRSLDDHDEPLPWLARSIEWDETEPAAATIELRQTPWHDGESVTAHDVAFTYEFLQDTSLGKFDSPVPTSWRRGRASLVESVSVHSDGQFRIEFVTPNREVAYRALSAPILPEHIWRDRSESTDVAGIDIAGQTTEALVSANEEAIGNGPVQFDDAVTDESISFDVFEDHFLRTGEADGIPPRFVDDGAFDRIEFTVAPSHDAAVELLVNDDADASADGLQASVVPRIVRSEGVSLAIQQSDPFYHLGFNCRRSPMTDPRFRRIAARHIDRAFILEESMERYGLPSEVPLKQEWTPQDLDWSGEATLPFLGENGELNVEEAREAFREAGYQYEEEQLIRRGGS
ncbi:MAG: ABC transporter substrate-binding protein [Halobacteriota archaeon]|uniref:ABC transporter substrate-binding protein n=1 Tax=Natronomonas sp. TaxID=2184060 RepID=UPI0039768A88